MLFNHWIHFVYQLISIYVYPSPSRFSKQNFILFFTNPNWSQSHSFAVFYLKIDYLVSLDCSMSPTPICKKTEFSQALLSFIAIARLCCLYSGLHCKLLMMAEIKTSMFFLFSSSSKLLIFLVVSTSTFFFQIHQLYELETNFQKLNKSVLSFLFQ